MKTIIIAINSQSMMFLVQMATVVIFLLIIFLIIWCVFEDMTDEFDLASDIEQQHRDSAINAIRKKKPVAQAIGLCLNCMAEVSEGRRWCCADCRDQWSKENER